ncbi:LysR family transcriptional regulator [Acidocella aminolytica]|jgi:DNA-binding transcriptional LysR family regulator|uniref:Transcriptional regulator LysR n=1 Tax=Acidocella aminolytica 101 = DSM 11237 TaxID=1120923 RepID=A0A0D6PCU8_9PROT|nr:LysR family transcriptional regulator [Acidocella aminolytica]GAN79043.1 transcriptional regulator LysR [Acidocella aminolytica 101 = DSM 11237]GBQ32207.1 LysR family transcriptional regulator [Acidocella aminolytica 101 = DSM 11237]SHF15491.1 DNA-binding transcriptional regulator, LysR family [Acidocella aminolytica 101 = DSM 11237]
MPRDQINELAAFLIVARERSFTKAAAELGVTPSALSHTVKGLESRLGLRLLSRTTRTVAPTEAGERLQRRIGPLFEQVSAELDAITSMRNKPAGSIRITCVDAAIETVFRPKLGAFLQKYPDIKVELSMDYALVDIVGERFDAGVRIGEALEKDMVATRISPDWRFCVLGSPAYFERRSPPNTPYELSNHNCINMRMTTAGGNLRWEFRSPEGHDFMLRVEGQTTFSNSMLVLAGALDGLGLGYVPYELAETYLREGKLVDVLSEWCPLYEGYYLYYPSRKLNSPAFSAFVEAMRFNE